MCVVWLSLHPLYHWVFLQLKSWPTRVRDQEARSKEHVKERFKGWRWIERWLDGQYLDGGVAVEERMAGWRKEVWRVMTGKRNKGRIARRMDRCLDGWLGEEINR